MKLRREALILLAVFLAVFISRLVISFGSSNFTYDAYFNIRQVQVIRESWVFTFNDELSYAPHPFMPLFHYLMAFLSIFFPIGFVLKVVPNFLASLVVFLSYFLAFEITRDRLAALFSAMSAGFVPVFFFKTVNSVSEYSLVTPLFLLLVYLFMRLNANNLVLFLFALFALVLSHPSAILFVSGLSFYVFLLYVIGARATGNEMETILFSLISSVWLVFLFFKTPLLLHGMSVLWAGIPSPVQFSNFNILDGISKIGILTFFAGIFISHRYVFEEKRKDMHVLISLSFVVLILLIVRLVSLDTGLMFLGIFFAVMSGQAYKLLFDYLKKTHISRSVFLVAVFLIAVFIATSVLTSISYASTNFFDEPSDGEVEAFEWLSGVEPGQVVFADVREGSMVTSISFQRNFIDNRFTLSDDMGRRMDDLEVIFSSQSQIAAMEVLEKYDVSYMVLTRRALASRNLSGLRYYSQDCFEPVFENRDAVIYRTLCRVTV
ncbi:hypothetical protein HYU11_06260 [Candidatus Woesearchaeota archaeon]|nr:hypothetical protein [Candidatus Woesearchaeota archaeon]